MTSRRGRIYTRGSRAWAQRSIVASVCADFSTATDLPYYSFLIERESPATHVDHSAQFDHDKFRGFLAAAPLHQFSFHLIKSSWAARLDGFLTFKEDGR